MTKENSSLLNEIYTTVQMGQHAIHDVLPKVTNVKLREKIESQSDAYGRLAGKSSRMLAKEKITPDKTTLMQRMGLWGSIQMNTLTDSSTTHIAEMMIEGSTMGITDITKILNHLDHADAGAKELAEEYLDCERKHIASMKKYL